MSTRSPRKAAPDKRKHEPEIDWNQVRRHAAKLGAEKFRPGQQEIIEAVLSGRDVLGVMPTGAGKSLTYQMAALMLPGSVVVVSPLIALMKDQHEKAEELDIAAAALNSTLTTSEEREAKEEIRQGEHELIYVTPERLENPEYLELLKKVRLSLFVVDEAHCVSQWGHDFRPAYLSLRDARRALGNPPLLALTATATPEVTEDVLKQLGTKNAIVVNTGIERDNLFFEVFRTVNADAKRERVKQLVTDETGTCIVYCATVRACNELWRWLNDSGVESGQYTGKLTKKQRDRAQQEFMDGTCRVMVATKAFGLGIDKPDVRTVIHYNFPDSLESYYQEAGRAGRDGRASHASLLYQLEDRRVQSFFLGGKYPKREQTQQVVRVVREMLAQAERAQGVSSDDLANVTSLPKRKVQVVVAQLDGAGIIERKAYRIRTVREFKNEEELEQVLREYEERGSSDRERLETMMRYAQTTMCRVRFMKEYFGEGVEEDCGHCDNCRARAEGTLTTQAADTAAVRGEKPAADDRAVVLPAEVPEHHQPSIAVEELAPAPDAFTEGQQVRHKSFGTGEVVESQGDRIIVQFPRRGKKTVKPEFLKKVA